MKRGTTGGVLARGEYWLGDAAASFLFLILKKKWRKEVGHYFIQKSSGLFATFDLQKFQERGRGVGGSQGGEGTLAKIWNLSMSLHFLQQQQQQLWSLIYTGRKELQLIYKTIYCCIWENRRKKNPRIHATPQKNNMSPALCGSRFLHLGPLYLTSFPHFFSVSMRTSTSLSDSIHTSFLGRSISNVTSGEIEVNNTFFLLLLPLLLIIIMKAIT